MQRTGSDCEPMLCAACHTQQRAPPISDRRCDVLRLLVGPAMRLVALLATNAASKRYGPL